jgi:hypothetical protein
LLFSIWDEASYRSLVALVFGGLLNFVVNGIALYLRTPPDDREGSQETIHPGFPALGHYISKADVLALDRGQKHIIDLVESVLRNQELRPDKVTWDPVIYPEKFQPRK